MSVSPNRALEWALWPRYARRKRGAVATRRQLDLIEELLDELGWTRCKVARGIRRGVSLLREPGRWQGL